MRTEISPQIHKTMAEYFILRTLMLALKLWSHKSPKQFHISILLFTEKKKKIPVPFRGGKTQRAWAFILKPSQDEMQK